MSCCRSPASAFSGRQRTRRGVDVRTSADACLLACRATCPVMHSIYTLFLIAGQPGRCGQNHMSGLMRASRRRAFHLHSMCPFTLPLAPRPCESPLVPRFLRSTALDAPSDQLCPLFLPPLPSPCRAGLPRRQPALTFHVRRLPHTAALVQHAGRGTRSTALWSKATFEPPLLCPSLPYPNSLTLLPLITCGRSNHCFFAPPNLQPPQKNVPMYLIDAGCGPLFPCSALTHRSAPPTLPLTRS